MKIVGNIQGKTILLLQGPMGTFFKRLADYFREHGATVYTICFNAGDFFFAEPTNRFCYKDSPNNWQDYLEEFLNAHKIEKIFLFGNCRFYHKVAIHSARKAGIDVYVFEEGYVRPHFVTLERDGVNGESSISLDAQFYKRLPSCKLEREKNAQASYPDMAVQASTYYVLTKIFSPLFPNYQHHRDLFVGKEIVYGLRSGFRKLKYKLAERKLYLLLTGELKRKYFFVPLQTRTDFQLLKYSQYASIEEFIDKVLLSFSEHAHAGTSLIIKHHPMERGMSTYADFIVSRSQEYGLEKRVFPVFDVHLPTCLQNALGTITINSTVGLSALFHQSPTIALGKAVYDIEGLTCKGMTLDQFWQERVPPDRELFLKYRNYVIEKTQLNGGFYGKFPDFEM